MPSHSERVRRNYPPDPERPPEEDAVEPPPEPGRSDEAPSEPRRPTPPPKRPNHD